MHIYIYVYTAMYAYIYTYMCIYIHIHIYIYIYWVFNVCICVYLSICKYIYAYMCSALDVLLVLRGFRVASIMDQKFGPLSCRDLGSSPRNPEDGPTMSVFDLKPSGCKHQAFGNTKTLQSHGNRRDPRTGPEASRAISSQASIDPA